MKKLLIIILFISTAACDSQFFDFSNSSYIYLSNNSSHAISLSFSGTLQQEYWKVENTTIPPYHSKPILSIKRNNGFPSGQVFTLKTHIELQDSTSVDLIQILRSSTTRDTLDYSAYSSSFNTGSIADSLIHRYELTPELEFASKAENKVLFKDIHYAITEETTAIDENNNTDALEILTYNTWGLPLIASNIEARFNLIPGHIKNYDIVLLQEVFDASRNGLLQALETEYPYRTTMLNGPENRLYDGGIIIVSRFPIVNEGQYIFPDCSGADCFADKGINYAEIIKGGKSYHVFATHTASFDTSTARNHRQIQFNQMKTFANSFSIPNTDTVIYAGDLNVNKLRFADDFSQMLNTLNSDEPIYTGYAAATFDPDINLSAQDPLSGANHKQYIDYILISNDYAGFSNNENRVFIPRSSHNAIWGSWDLSDHFPVHGSIQ